MSKKNRKGRQRNVPRPERARRQLEKGDAKAALKEAKLCFRAEASNDHRQLLEEAYLGRVEQLRRLQKLTEAKTVLAELVELNPTTPEVSSQLPRLQVIVGDPDADANALLAADPSLLTEMVDQAVLNGTDVPEYGDVKPQVVAVREALAAVERGEDEQAAELLKIVSISSPLADWRLLVRGLSAFYKQDEERAKKNWQRLDVARPGSRIAQTLLTAAGMTAPEERTPDLSEGLRKIAAHVRSESFEGFQQLGEAWKLGDWKPFFQRYRQLRQRFAKSHETLIRQIVDLLWKRAVREGDFHLFDSLIKVGPAPAFDPRWKRAEALLLEHPQSEYDVDDMQSAWIAYAHDVSQLACLREEERPIAVGLVYQRLARNCRRHADESDGPSAFGYYYDDQGDQNLRNAAAEYYRKSIEAWPSLNASYIELADLYEEDEEGEMAARVVKQLARQDPDCFEAAIWLAHHYLSQDDPGKSEPYVAAAKRLRPRDRLCETLTWNQRVAMIRCLTIKRQFEAARHETKQAAELVASDVEPFTLDLLRAGIEFKAKHLEAAQRHLDTALAQVEEPTPIWLQMSCTAARMRLAREFKKDFDDRFKSDIKKTPISSSAGRMAKFMCGIKVSKTNYTGRATQERLLIDYLRRATSIDWNENDLRHVCEFLDQVPRQSALREHFVDVGIERFPRAPHFHFWAGLQEIGSGPYYCDIASAIECLQSAIDLNNESQSKLYEADLEEAKSALSMLKDFRERTELFDEGTPFYDDDEEDDDEEDYEDDDIGFHLPPGIGGLMDEDDDDFAPARIDNATLGMLERTMPPDIRRQLEQVCRMTGLNPSEALRMMLERSGEFRVDDESDAIPAPQHKQTRNRRRQKGSRR